MTPFRYKAKILPDGHLPLPGDFPVRTGEEIEVTLSPAEPGNGAAEAIRRADHILERWAGVGRGGGSGVAERHDDHLYGR